MSRLLLCLLMVVSVSQIFAQDFKVVGYLPYYRFGVVDQVDLSKLTHLNLSFANPDMDGNLSIGGQDIDPIVAMAKEEGLQVLISVAGGALTSEWAAAWASLIQPQNRSAFIHKLILYVQDHDLDGVDVDLEWSHVDQYYSGFVLELRDSLDAHNKLMTAALPGTYRYPDISDEAMLSYDFINMMVYDLTGPWAPNNPGPHSPYSFAVNAIQYWQNQGMPADRLTLGVPFYGWDFTNLNNVVSFTFASMVAEDEAYAQLDQVGQAYYNGIPTIKMKTELALEEVAGIMIWELGQDAFNEFSLLTVIDETINGVVAVNNTQGSTTTLVFPNPFNDRLIVENTESEQVEGVLSDLNGRSIRRLTIEPNSNSTIEATDLPAGFYVLNIFHSERTEVFKVVRQ